MRTRRLLAAALAILIALGALAWTLRKDILIWVARRATQDRAIAPYSRVAWQQGPESAELPPGERPPNIVVILADDLGINDITTFGGGVAGGRVPTPGIDRIAREGVRFTQGYTSSATCAPSRAMLLTGRYPTRTGFAFTPAPPSNGRLITLFGDHEKTGLPPAIWHPEASAKLPPIHEQGLPGSEVTIAEILKERGYHTVHIGKWHLGTGPEFGPNAQGFDESLMQWSGLYLPEDDARVVNSKQDFDAVDEFLWAVMQYAVTFNDGPPFEPGGYITDWWTDEAIEVIRANRNRPFFLYLAHWAPHTPLQALRSDYEAVGELEPHRLRVYAAMVRALDRGVGRVLDALREEGLEENTIVVFASDNGGAGYVGIPDLNAPYRGWKATFFEGGVRTPFFVRWPARIAAGSENARPVAHVDLTPTLARAAGAALPEGVAIDGIDIFDPSSRRPDDAIFWQSDYYLAVRQGDWKLQVDEKRERVWLFDLASDPTERNDLAQTEPARVAAMRQLLDRYREGARPPLYPSYLESPIAVDRTKAERAVEGDEFVYWPN